jgi:hypothetical protein
MTADLLGPADRAVDGAAGRAAAGAAGRPAGRLAGSMGIPGAGRILGRLGGRMGRRGREVAAAAAGSLLVSAVMTWPVLRSPARTVPQDLGDPLYFVWQVAWAGHALRTDPAGMWTTNAFNHAGSNLAYTDTMLGYAPFSAVFDLFGGMGAALLSYNLLYVLAAAMAFGGAYLLARALGANIPGALVLAAAYGFAPWRLAHARHLNVLSTGGIVLALALLAYGHGWMLRRRAVNTAGAASAGRPRPLRPGFIVAGWAVACWQLTLGFAVGMAFAWVMAGVMASAIVIGWRGRPWDARVVRADVWGGAVFVLTGLALTWPYLVVLRRFPVAARTDGMVGAYSPRPNSFFTAPAESWWWGALQHGWRAGFTSPAEQVLLPGLVVTVLAVAGLRWSVWTPRARIGLLVSVLGFALLALGTSAPGGGRYTYLLVFHHLPGWSALRTPGRLVLWCGLALGLLAAGAVTAWAEAWHTRQAAGDKTRVEARENKRSGWWRAAVLLIPAVLVLSEGTGAVAQPVVPTQPVALKDLPGPVLVMPTSMTRDYLIMTWSTDGWPSLVNGGSGFESPRQSRLRTRAAKFPAPLETKLLRRMGVRTIVLLRSQAIGTQWEKLATQPVSLTRSQVYAVGASVREDAGTLIFDLDP